MNIEEDTHLGEEGGKKRMSQQPGSGNASEEDDKDRRECSGGRQQWL